MAITVCALSGKSETYPIKPWVLLICLGLFLVGCSQAQTRSSAKSAALPARVRELVNQAHILFARDQFQQASRLYLQAVNQYPNLYEAHHALVIAEQTRGRLGELEVFYRDKLARQSDHAGWHFGLALASWLDNRRAGAIRACSTADELDPHSAEVALLKGTILLYQARAPKAARQQFLRSTKLDAGFAPGYFNLAVMARDIDKDNRQAEALALKALPNFKPYQKLDKLETHLFLARLYEKDKRLEDALKQYDKAKAIDSARTYSQVDPGKLLLALGRPDQAKKERISALERIGWGSPGGLRIIRNMKGEEGKLLDYTHLLAQGSPREYAGLLSNAGRLRPTSGALVPVELQQYLLPLNVVVKIKKVDLDQSGDQETIVVEATQSRYRKTPSSRRKPAQPADFQLRYEEGSHFVLSQPVLHIFSSWDDHLVACKLGYEHLWKLALVDLNADGKKEIIATGIKGPNEFCLNVIAEVGKGFGTVFATSVTCWSKRAGFLVCDLQGDDHYEIVAIGGTDHWIDVYGWEGSGFAKRNARYPQFYTWYVKEMESQRNARRREEKLVAIHLQEARAILAGSHNTRQPNYPPSAP